MNIGTEAPAEFSPSQTSPHASTDMPSASPFYELPAMETTESPGQQHYLCEFQTRAKESGHCSQMQPHDLFSQSMTCVIDKVANGYRSCSDFEQPKEYAQQNQSYMSYSRNLCGEINNGYYDPVKTCTNEGSQDYTYLSWTRKHPENWNANEVIDWLFHTAETHNIDCGVLHGEAFQRITGSQLCKMSREELLHLEPQYGTFYHDLLKTMCQTAAFVPVSDIAYRSCSDFDMPSPMSTVSTQNKLTVKLEPSCLEDTMHCDYSVKQEPNSSPISLESYPSFSELQPSSYPGSSYKADPSLSIDFIDGQKYDFDPFDAPHVSVPGDSTDAAVDNLIPELSSHSLPPSHRDMYFLPHDRPYQRRRPGRPRVKSLPSAHALVGRRGEKRGKNQHLWEFIYDALMNPLYSPQYLRWENQRDGVFRFVQSEAVAQLWGSLKNNENMTYEKLSRAMRHYYKRGLLERVEGRRLVYKFSQLALERMRERYNSV